MEVDEDYYLLWRLEQGVAEGSVEIPKGWLAAMQFLRGPLNLLYDEYTDGCEVICRGGNTAGV